MGQKREMTELHGISGRDEAPLDAYIDGELDAEGIFRIEQRLLRDHAAADYVKQVRRLQALSRRHLQEAADRPITDDLAALLERIRQKEESGRSGRNQQGWAWGRPLAALAASLLILFLGYGMGVMITEGRFENRLVTMEQSRTASLAEIKAALNRVLEYNPSGTAVNWQSKRYNATAELVPIRTLKTGKDKYCREYREIVIIDGAREARRGLSCRLGKEQWQTRLLMPEKGKELF